LQAVAARGFIFVLMDEMILWYSFSLQCTWKFHWVPNWIFWTCWGSYMQNKSGVAIYV